MQLSSLLDYYTHHFGPVLPASIQWGANVVLNMNEPYWQNAHQCTLQELIDKTAYLLECHNAQLAIGRYGEDRRFLYQRSDLFQHNRALRSIHLGMDLTLLYSCPVYAPYKGVVHSFADHDCPGDYGPTIILQHTLQDVVFYTLYGHLSKQSLKKCQVGQIVQKGECLGALGEPEVNGGWPIHLHFQIIKNLHGFHSGYPGVVEPNRAGAELANCPDPDKILSIMPRA